jgi:hypothetical protein
MVRLAVFTIVLLTALAPAARAQSARAQEVDGAGVAPVGSRAELDAQGRLFREKGAVVFAARGRVYSLEGPRAELIAKNFRDRTARLVGAVRERPGADPVLSVRAARTNARTPLRSAPGSSSGRALESEAVLELLETSAAELELGYLHVRSSEGEGYVPTASLFARKLPVFSGSLDPSTLALAGLPIDLESPVRPLLEDKAREGGLVRISGFEKRGAIFAASVRGTVEGKPVELLGPETHNGLTRCAYVNVEGKTRWAKLEDLAVGEAWEGDGLLDKLPEIRK